MYVVEGIIRPPMRTFLRTMFSVTFRTPSWLRSSGGSWNSSPVIQSGWGGLANAAEAKSPLDAARAPAAVRAFACSEQ